jgi:hypothetical protein
VRVRVVLVVATLVVAGALALDLSGSAARSAGSDHYAPLMFTTPLTAGGSVCQPLDGVPGDAARAEVTVGTYGRPLPPLTLRFLTATGHARAEGTPPPGSHEGVVTFPLRHHPGALEAREACLHVGAAKGPIIVAGEGVPESGSSVRVNGHVHAGRISILYLRGGSENWWQLLPTLAQRFGLGKAAFLGTWLLPLCAAALAGIWVAALRLLSRELR